MKSIKIIIGILALFLLFFVAGCVKNANKIDVSEGNSLNPYLENYIEKKQENNFPSDTSNLRILELGLPGMFCAGCAMGAESALISSNGVVEAKIDLKNKKGNVIYDSTKTSADELVKNAVIQGYDGSVLSDEKYESTTQAMK